MSSSHATRMNYPEPPSLPIRHNRPSLTEGLLNCILCLR